MKSLSARLTRGLPGLALTVGARHELLLAHLHRDRMVLPGDVVPDGADRFRRGRLRDYCDLGLAACRSSALEDVSEIMNGYWEIRGKAMDDILERPRSFEVQASARIAELERALLHAQEAIFW